MTARCASRRETSSASCRTARTDGAKARAYPQVVEAKTLAMASMPGLGHPTASRTTTRAGSDDGSTMCDPERPRNVILAEDLSQAARRCQDARIRGAILAVASLDDGMTLTDAARIWCVDLVILRDVIRRLDESGLDGLEDLVAAPKADSDVPGLQSSRATRRT